MLDQIVLDQMAAKLVDIGPTPEMKAHLERLELWERASANDPAVLGVPLHEQFPKK